MFVEKEPIVDRIVEKPKECGPFVVGGQQPKQCVLRGREHIGRIVGVAELIDELDEILL